MHVVEYNIISTGLDHMRASCTAKLQVYHLCLLPCKCVDACSMCIVALSLRAKGKPSARHDCKFEFHKTRCICDKAHGQGHITSALPGRFAQQQRKVE